MTHDAALHGEACKTSPLHGRRSGKPLPDYQRELMRTLLPRLAVDVGAPIDPGRLFGRLTSGAVCDVRLEIGFGHGEHLIAAARRDPDVGFIGCEPFLNGMARALADIAEGDLDNVRLYNGDAGDVLDSLPAGCLGRVFVLYADPWPKRRHKKRRLMSDEMLVRLARAMRPGAELRFATDIDDYCGWALARLSRSPDFRWTAERACDWQTPWPDWTVTRYERKAAGQGRRPCYLTALRQES